MLDVNFIIRRWFSQARQLHGRARLCPVASPSGQTLPVQVVAPAGPGELAGLEKQNTCLVKLARRTRQLDIAN